MEEISNTGEYLPKYDVYIQYLRLPKTVGGFSTKVRCEPVAAIGEGLTDEEKLLAIWHEILHILRGDLDRDADIEELEEFGELIKLYAKGLR